MQNEWKIIAACLPAILLSNLMFAADINLDVSVNRSSIYIGESAILTIKASGMDSPQAMPDLSAITNCSIKLYNKHKTSLNALTETRI